jgi:sugar lactone lactonase YvrE
VARFDVRQVLDIKASLGEAPLWSEDEQALIWLDMRGATLNSFDPISGRNRVWQLPAAHPGSFTFCAGGIALATNTGMFRFGFSSEKFERIGDVPLDPAVFRFNDGKADRQGRFWIGSMLLDFKHEGPGQGTYYRFEAGQWTPFIEGIRVPNGTAFSPDGTIMYRAETMARVIIAYAYDPATGTPSKPRTFASFPDGFGIPDGATVDSEGGYWVAVPFGDSGRIARFTPDGRLDLHIELPVLAGTMVAFGGKDMSTLFITTGSIEAVMNREPSPLGGDLFAVETGFRGIAEAVTAI